MKKSIIESRKNAKIIRNNVIAVLLSQVVIGVISYLTGAPIYAYIWGEMNENPSAIAGTILLFLHVLFVLYLYFLVGRRFLKKIETKGTTIVSVWFLSVLLFGCLIGLLLDNDAISSIGIGLFNPIALSIGLLFGSINGSTLGIDATVYMFILAPILPSLGLWLGISNKKKIKTSKQKNDRNIPTV